MKAITQEKYGPPEVLELHDIDKPIPKKHEVLIEVHAAGIDPSVWHLMTGLPYLVRLGFGLRGPKTKVPGKDVSGHVAAVGAEVTRFKVGDQVYGTCDGAFAEYATAPQDRLALKPASLSFEEAAAVPISACAALHGLKPHVRPGQNVLIIGAGGGIGTFAVQLAVAFGATVTGVCSTAKVELVRSLGAADVIDYTREDFVTRPDRYDLILDVVSNRSLKHLRQALTPRGKLVIGGGEAGGPWLGVTDRLLRAMLLSPFVGQSLRGFVSSEEAEVLAELGELIESGDLTPVVDRTYRLHEAPDAIRDLTEGRARGKLVVTMPNS